MPALSRASSSWLNRIRVAAETIRWRRKAAPERFTSMGKCPSARTRSRTSGTEWPSKSRVRISPAGVVNFTVNRMALFQDKGKDIR